MSLAAGSASRPAWESSPDSNSTTGSGFDVQLVGVRAAAEGVALFDFSVAGAGASLPHAPPGSHLRLELPNGLIRPYFIAERSRRGTYVIGVRRDPDGRGSKYLHDKVRVGAALRIAVTAAPALDLTVPRATVSPSTPRRAAASRVVVVAEDIGIFYAWSIIRALDARDVAWELHYDAWSPTSAPLLNELRAFGSRVRAHVRSGAHGRALDWSAVVAGLGPDVLLHACGSPETRSALDEALARAGPEGSPQVRWTSSFEAPARGRVEFEVVLARSGTTLAVREGETILEALRAAKVEVRSFCAAGICGTCRTRVLAGTPRHLDAVLTAPERASNAVMMICRSRADSAQLVLDL